MSQFTSTRYYQLTREIMLEYVYSETGKENMEGDVTDRFIDLKNTNALHKIDSKDTKKMYLFCRDDDGDNKSGHNYDNLVVAVNNNDSKFVKMKNELGMKYTYNNFNIVENIPFTNEDVCDVVFDKCIIHFTGSNYFGDYDSLIFQAFVKDTYGNKISLASILFNRTDKIELNERPLMINQKLYTTHISFRIPSTSFLLDKNGKKSLACVPNFDCKEVEEPVLKLQTNSSIEFNVLGVKTTYQTNGFTFFNTVELNSIQFKNFDNYKKVNIEIEEATDGDYFKIYAQVNRGGNNVMSFSDYMYSMDINPTEYIVMYEISLIENYVDIYNELKSIKTHTEYYLVNMSINEDDNELDDVVRYRPVCVYSNKDISFTIDVKLRIINTEDNTTIVKSAFKDFSQQDSYTSKYGKKIQRIMSDEYPINVNVYNKRNDEDLDYVKISKSNGKNGNMIENHQYYISSLVECTNIGVSVQKVPQVEIES